MTADKPILLKETEEYVLSEIRKNKYEITIKLKQIPIERYFKEQEDIDFLKNYAFYEMPIEEYISGEISNGEKENNFRSEYLSADQKYLIWQFSGDAQIGNDFILEKVRDYYEKNAVHITRMFGSYIILSGNGEDLSAIRATKIPIKYCPLMMKLLREVGGKTSERLIEAIQNEEGKQQSELLCKLIDEVVIKGGYFDTNRPLNSCEANVLFGASETISSAFTDDLLDAAVIVSNNLGTIITTNNENTQGAVKRMTGLFYTSPSKQIMKTACEADIIPVFPYTAEIDQIAGVRKAISLGYKRIAVTLASSDNLLQTELKALEQEYDVTIYSFGLCSTGISEQAAMAMKENADIVWSCASKQIVDHIEPYSVAQVGVKIPVHIMTKKGWNLVKGHLHHMNEEINFDQTKLSSGDDKPVFLNDGDNIKQIRKDELQVCIDCPHPCI